MWNKTGPNKSIEYNRIQIHCSPNVCYNCRLQINWFKVKKRADHYISLKFHPKSHYLVSLLLPVWNKSSYTKPECSYIFNALWLHYIGGRQQIESRAQGINCRFCRCLNTSRLLWFVLWSVVPLMKSNLNKHTTTRPSLGKDFLIWTVPVGACWLSGVMMESFQLDWWLLILLSHSSSLFPLWVIIYLPYFVPFGEG